jgi:hypothetical protein
MVKHRSQPKVGDIEAQTSSNQDSEIAGVKWDEDSSHSHSGATEKLKGGHSISVNETRDLESTQPDAALSATPRNWFHLWNSPKLPHRSSEAHAVARAEAASWAQMTPLIAATFGPFAVLLGIPSLTQRLHAQIVVNPSDGSSTLVELPYPTINLALSAVVMFCEVLGNTFLVMRFSNFHTKLMTWMSYAFWLAKSLIGIANYIQFGIAHPETEDIVYLQGFWVSLILIF